MRTKSSATASVLNDYLKLKNALAEDNDANAAAAAKSLVVSFTNIDQAKLPSAQAKIFSEISADAKEHAEHIGQMRVTLSTKGSTLKPLAAKYMSC
ncbi:DUF3347 domain-containing protein [Pedobacter fastidiosus]|uniref:DUF3347 domain-containing protein n=1 Tax=Pedobacter fastidiosus TaxID=2765361 RepID=UPI003611D053